MAEAFDPYHTWLGIRPEEQPPNLYRLLGLPLFEDNAEAIHNAADARMLLLRTLQTGRHAQLAHRLLNEISAARLTLADPKRKAAYDERLRRQMEAAGPGGLGASDVGAKVPAAPPGTGSHRAAASGIAGRGRGEETTLTASDLGQLGEYQLLEKLGEGGMGAVFKALHIRLGRVVALKILPRDRVWDDRAIARFEREMKAVGALDHPNIIRAMDAREVEGTRFLVMEYVDGADLNALGRACHPLSLADACEIIRQAAIGLEEAHRHGLVHRDVKPSNFMVTTQGVVKLLDLGLARFEADPNRDEVTGTGEAMGTVDYMAPEQIADSHSADARSDIYSLGCTFYKLLTGRTPFGGPEYKGVLERLAAHARDPVPPIHRFRPDVPPPLVAAIDRMLAKDPAKRFSAAAQVADAVGPFARGANLAALVARALGRPAPAELAAQTQAVTQDLPSPTPAEFFSWLEAEQRTPASHPPPLPKARSWKLPAALAAVAVGVVAVVTLIFGGVFSRRSVTDQALLILDWPEAERRDVRLRIDQREVPFPPRGPLEYPCRPGQHRITATRPGYMPFETTITADPGQQYPVVPTWVRQTFLVLQWPLEEWSGARLEIDGQAQDLGRLELLAVGGEVHLPLKPGPHQITITRLGYEPFVWDFVVSENEDVVLRPVWKEHVPLAQDTKSPPSPPPAQKPAEPAPAKPELAKPEPPKPEPGKVEPGKPEPGMTAKTEPGTPAKSEPALSKGPEKPPGPEPSSSPKPELSEAEKQAEARAARFAALMEPVESLVAEWQFQAAVQAVDQLRLDDPELRPRLAQRRNEIERLVGLKTKIIAAIAGAEPPLKKSALGIKGMGGDIVKADEDGLTAKLINGKSETVAWNSLSSKALAKLLPMAIDRAQADDWIAAGLLCLVGRDALLAEKCFEQAQSLGAGVDPYLGALAEAAWRQVQDLLASKQFSEAEALLSVIEQKYAQTPWFVANRTRFGAARKAAQQGLAETEAEKLYAQAVKHFAAKDLFEVRPLIEKLRTEYPSSRAVTDPQREPSFAQMEKAVSDLGKVFIVRKDGKGDFKGIQEAIDAAPAKSIIEIRDNGPFYEKVVIPGEKPGITLRGGRGFWPVIRSGGPLGAVIDLVAVDAADTTLERLVIAHTDSGGRNPRALRTGAGCRARWLFFSGGGDDNVFGPSSQIEQCVMAGFLRLQTPCVIRDAVNVDSNGSIETQGAGKAQVNNVFVRGIFTASSPADLRCCTVLSSARFNVQEVTAVDSIFGEVIANRPGSTIEFCDVPGKFVEQARPGKGCFALDPQFADPQNLDYRLRPTSPCIRRASDGGDVGFRFNPQIVEMLKLAALLRTQGLMAF